MQTQDILRNEIYALLKLVTIHVENINEKVLVRLAVLQMQEKLK